MRGNVCWRCPGGSKDSFEKRWPKVKCFKTGMVWSENDPECRCFRIKMVWSRGIPKRR